MHRCLKGVFLISKCLRSSRSQHVNRSWLKIRIRCFTERYTLDTCLHSKKEARGP